MADRADEFQRLSAANSARADVLRDLRNPSRAEKVELSIRSATERFVNGTTTHNGAWTVTNLVVESGVPRPTLYRYEAPLRDFHALAEVAPRGSGGVKEELQRLRAELRTERRERIEDRKRYEHVQAVLVQRVHALTLALAQASGQSKVVSLLRGETTGESLTKHPGDS